MKEALFACSLLLVTASGCFLFRSSIDRGSPEMTDIPGGSFMMGDFHEQSNDDALPRHLVQVEAFRLSVREVSYDEYDSFALRTGRVLPDDDGFGRGARAVANVTWGEALAFCQSKGLRLPSEAEWEYAAREGGKDIIYAGTNKLDSLASYARYRDNSVGFSAPSGRKKPNALGLYDMSGNVAEWTGDYYQFYPENGVEPSYTDLDFFGIRIVRGGYFDHEEWVLRTYWRTGTLKDTQTFSIGFRCAGD